MVSEEHVENPRPSIIENSPQRLHRLICDEKALDYRSIADLSFLLE
jgi:hypothetical protein